MGTLIEAVKQNVFEKYEIEKRYLSTYILLLSYFALASFTSKKQTHKFFDWKHLQKQIDAD